VFPLDIIRGDHRGVEFVDADLTAILGITNYKDAEEIKDSVGEHHKKNPIVNFLFKYRITRPLANLLTPHQTKSAFPNFIKKTDEERIQNKPDFASVFVTNKLVFCTEKLDGQSGTYFFRKKSWFRSEFGVCSRNLHLKTKHACTWWQIAERYDFERKLKSLGRNIYIQGEIVGPNIQGNKYKLPVIEFYLFNAYDLDHNVYLTYGELNTLAATLGCNIVPIVPTHCLSQVLQDGSNFVQSMVSFSKGFSVINPCVIREGIVVREDAISFKNSIKVINPDFLLKNDE
jgi:RNA ligase (TIGR02306 family)